MFQHEQVILILLYSLSLSPLLPQILTGYVRDPAGNEKVIKWWDQAIAKIQNSAEYIESQCRDIF